MESGSTSPQRRSTLFVMLSCTKKDVESYEAKEVPRGGPGDGCEVGFDVGKLEGDTEPTELADDVPPLDLRCGTSEGDVGECKCDEMDAIDARS